VIGPNGAGKSTLLRAATGLIPVSRGRVTWAGCPASPSAHCCAGIAIEPVSVRGANSCRETVWRGQRPRRYFWRRLHILRDRDWPLSRLLRQSPGKLKTFSLAAGNRLCAGLRGGGRTPPRPVSNTKFPDNREINREFFDFGPFWAILASNRRANSDGYNGIPYATEQGIFSAEQGMFLRE
jgi:energy-coupling factor transporter ATP-binding protein EcfA2